jgi:hypothetical protein
MMARRELPNRRDSETFSFEVVGLRYTCTFSKFASGEVAELFLQNSKPSSQSDTNARDSAVAASLALQFGCPLETLKGAVLRNSHNEAASPLGAAIDRIAALSGKDSRP